MDVMQGYCWPLSAAPGEQIELRMSTGAAQYTVSYLRFNNRGTGLVTAQDIDASSEFVEVALLPPSNSPGGSRTQVSLRTSAADAGKPISP